MYTPDITRSRPPPWKVITTVVTPHGPRDQAAIPCVNSYLPAVTYTDITLKPPSVLSQQPTLVSPQRRASSWQTLQPQDPERPPARTAHGSGGYYDILTASALG
jgi:hypothetical protein